MYIRLLLCLMLCVSLDAMQEKEHEEKIVLNFLDSLHFDQETKEIESLMNQAYAHKCHKHVGIISIQEEKRCIQIAINKEAALIDSINNFLTDNPTIGCKILLKHLINDIISCKNILDNDLWCLNDILQEYAYNQRNKIKTSD